MPTNFVHLVREIAALADIPRPEQFKNAMALRVDGVFFSIYDNDAEDPGTFTFACEICSLPDEDFQNELLQALLDANFRILGRGSAAFALDTARGLVLLAGCMPLAAVTGESVLESFAIYATEAKRWQQRIQTRIDAAAAASVQVAPQGATAAGGSVLRKQDNPAPLFSTQSRK